MALIDAIREFSCEVGDEEVLLAEGFEEAFVGILHRCSQPPIAIFDYSKALDVLMKRDGCTREEAVEHLDFNAVGAWVGDRTPGWLFTFRPASDRPVPSKKPKYVKAAGIAKEKKTRKPRRAKGENSNSGKSGRGKLPTPARDS